jgi:GH24 family phage-related lysozyme (muramidase)
MATNSNADLKKALPVFAKNLGSIKLSLAKLIKNKEEEKKQRSIDRQKQRASDYAARYKKTPSPVEKKVVEQEKKPFLQSIKDFFSGLLKFLVLGLGAIGLSKLLSNPQVMSTITDFLKKVVIGMSEAIQKGMKIVSNLLNDPEILSSVQTMIKKTFLFISDLVVKGANFISELVSDPQIQNTIKNVLVGIISTVKEIISSIFSVGKKMATENRDVIKTTIIDIITAIANAFVSALKFTEEIITNPAVKKAIVDIAYAIRDAIKTIMNAEFELGGVKTNLKQVLFTLGGAVVLFGLAIEAFKARLIGGMISDRLGGGRGPGGSRGRSAIDTILTVGTAGFLGYEAYKAFSDDTPGGEINERYLNKNTSNNAPNTNTSQTTTPSKTYPIDSVSNENRPSRVAPMMPKSLEEYLGMEYERKKAREGFRNKAYASPEGGTDTIGIGHKLSKDEQDRGGVFIGGKFIKADRNTGLTDEQVKALYVQDVMKHADGAKRQLNSMAKEDIWSKLNPMQQYALMDLSFAGGGRMFTQDLVNAIKANDMEKAAQIIQSKGRTYMKNGEMIKSAHHEKHADLRADIFRGNDPLLAAARPSTAPTQTASYTPNEQRPSKPYPDASMPTLASAGERKAGGHDYAPGGGGGAETPQKPKGIMETFVESLNEGLASLNNAAGGKLAFASEEVQALLRDKSFLSAFDSPVFNDMSKSMNTTDNTAINEKTPSVYDEILLSKLSRA